MRLPHFDYSQDAIYFVTFCTKNREQFFGNISNQIMAISDIGTIVENNWPTISKHRNNVILHDFVVMPNHFHGIIEIRNEINSMDVARNVPTTNRYSFISPKSGSLSAIIRAFKSSCSKEIHQAFPEITFDWQPRFYEHIVRDDEDLNRIKEYIANNVIDWDTDEFFL